MIERHKNVYELARIRTWNLLIRSQTRYPLRHKPRADNGKIFISLYKPSSVSDLLFVWREIWTACMHYRPKYGDVKPKQPTSPCRVLLLSATGGFSALKSVYGNVRHMKLCVKCQYCLHCESNHSFRWMPIALKDWTYILGGLAADVFQEKCEQNEKVLARRIWTTDLRISSWYFQLQSSALPTDLSRDA